MKKNLLALFALGSFFNANAQTVYVKDKAVVAVKSNTLMYMGNGLELSSSTPSQIVNEGNIQINLSNLKPGFTNIVGNGLPTTDTPYYFRNKNIDGTTDNDGSNFVNVYTDATHYGQLMFTLAKGNKSLNSSSDNNRILGKVTMQQPYANPDNYTWLPMSLPFNIPATLGASTENYISTFYTNNFSVPYLKYSDTNKDRYSSSMLKWDDRDFYYKTMEFDGTNTLRSVDLQNVYLLNLYNSQLVNTFKTNTGTSNRINYKGYPFGDSSSYVKLNTNGGDIPTINAGWLYRGAKYTPTESWQVWSERKAPSLERYKTFIGDSFTTYSPTSSKFGKWLVNFGNPYTHNIDIAALFANNSSDYRIHLLAVQKVGSQVKWVKGVGNTTPTQSALKASVTDNSTSATPDANNPDITNKRWVGDANALILKPFEIITFKLDRQVAGSYSTTFSDNDISASTVTGSRTFNMSASGLTGTASPGGKNSNYNISEVNQTNNLTNYGSNPGLYQLGLQISSKDGNQANNVYFVATENKVTGIRNGFELDFNDYGTNSGFWLNQEAADGSYDNGTYMYINGFNTEDYVAKPLRITFYKNPNDTNTTFTLGANLAEGSTINDGLEKLSNGNKFYFVDTKENKSIEITKDFSYTFNESETTSSRFVVYWNALPKTLGIGEAEVNKNKTFIYKNNGASNSIRFAKKNLTANVTVYNMSGQLISSKDNIVTNQDYVINNVENGMYIVNIQYSDNTVETLKSIFKK